MEWKFDSDFEEFITNVLEFQKANMIKNKVLLILDDMTMTKSLALNDLITKSRHFSLTILISSQYPKLLTSPIIRTNSHYIIWNELPMSGLQVIYDTVYLDIDKKEFFQFIYNLKQRYVFIWYNNISGNMIQDSYKLVKAREVKFNIINKKENNVKDNNNKNNKKKGN